LLSPWLRDDWLKTTHTIFGDKMAEEEGTAEELESAIEKASAALVHLRRIKSHKDDIDAQLGVIIALKLKYKEIKGLQYQKQKPASKHQPPTSPKPPKKKSKFETTTAEDAQTNEQPKPTLHGLDSCVDFLNNLSGEDFDSPLCRPLRLALRPFFLKMSEKEKTDTERREYELKRTIRKQNEAMDAKRRAKDKR
jgi:hypothetical protein